MTSNKFIIHSFISFPIHRVIPHSVYRCGPAGTDFHGVPDTFTALKTVYLLPFAFLYETLYLLQYHCILPLETDRIILFHKAFTAGQVKSVAVLAPVVIKLLAAFLLKQLPVLVGCVFVAISFLPATLSPDFVYHIFILLKVCVLAIF